MAILSTGETLGTLVPMQPTPSQPHTKTTDEVVKPSETLEDSARGVIEKLAEGEYHSILRITSKKGTVRANHYHKGDSHLCYCTRGKIEYVWRDARDASAAVRRVTIGPGQLFSSPPMVLHAMVFLEDSEFYAFTTSPRHTQKDYEEDIVRETLVSPEEAQRRAASA